MSEAAPLPHSNHIPDGTGFTIAALVALGSVFWGTGSLLSSTTATALGVITFITTIFKEFMSEDAKRRLNRRIEDVVLRFYLGADLDITARGVLKRGNLVELVDAVLSDGMVCSLIKCENNLWRRLIVQSANTAAPATVRTAFRALTSRQISLEVKVDIFFWLSKVRLLDKERVSLA